MRRALSRQILTVLVVTALGTAGLAILGTLPAVRAQTASDPATGLVESARRAHDLGRLDEAIATYGQAYQVSGDPRLLFEMAEAQREAGHTAESLRSFKTYLRRDPAGTYRSTAEKEVRELEQQLKANGGGATPAPAPKKAEAISNPEGVGKQTRPSVPPPIPASPPRTPAAPGLGRATAVAPTSPPPVAALPPAAPSPAARPVVAAPVTPAPSPPTTRPVVPVPPLIPPSSISTAATPIPATSAAIDLRPASSVPPEAAGAGLPTWVPWALGATTLALATGTVISGLSASSRFDELKNSCGQTGCPASEIDDVKSRARRTNVLLALTGAAALGTGIAVYFTADSAGATGQWRF